MRIFTAIALLVLCCSCSKKEEAAQTAPAVGPSPAVFRVKLDTSAGPIVVECHRDWSPLGADRFYDLVTKKIYDDNRFFRVVKGFIVQFGINGDPRVASYWRAMAIPDDPPKEHNTRGTIVFATAGPGTRTTQLFINLGDNSSSLDSQGFTPFGRVVEGMEIIDKINGEYGEQPDQARIETEGNDYLKKDFPKLDYIKTARVM